MKTLLISTIAAGFMVSTALAEPVELTDAQLDQVAAGAYDDHYGKDQRHGGYERHGKKRRGHRGGGYGQRDYGGYQYYPYYYNDNYNDNDNKNKNDNYNHNVNNIYISIPIYGFGGGGCCGGKGGHYPGYGKGGKGYQY